MYNASMTDSKKIKRQDPAVFDYTAEVAKARATFPDETQKLLFFDINTGRFPEPLSSWQKEDVKGWEVYCQMLEARYREKYPEVYPNSFCHPLDDGFKILFLLTQEKHRQTKLASGTPMEQETTFVFDHELAHAIIPGGMYDEKLYNRAESIGDAYAMIRHFQRYGADSPAVDTVAANRAFDMVFRDSFYGYSHFTSPVVEKIIEKRYEIDWDALTPEETCKMAKKFVLEHEMHEASVRVLTAQFKAQHDLADKAKAGDEKTLAALATRLLSTRSPNVFKYGALALCPVLEKANLQGEFWDQFREKFAQKQAMVANRTRLPVMKVSAPKPA